MKGLFGFMPLALVFLPLSLGHAQVAITAIPATRDFTAFAGAGFESTPITGQLDSNEWSVTGFSDGDLAFGGSASTGDYARGPSNGQVSIGGVYAFNVGGANVVLGFQATGADFTPGTITMRLVNQTGSPIDQISVSYDLWTLNNGDRSSSVDFSYSTDNSVFTPVPALDFATPEPAEVSPSWDSAIQSTTIQSLGLSNGALFYLRWTSDDASGTGARDEFGIDNVVVAVPPATPVPTLSRQSTVALAALLLVVAAAMLASNRHPHPST